MTEATWAGLSNLLMDATIVAYSLAAFAFALEMLNTRVVPVRDRKAAKELVGAGAPVAADAADDAANVVADDAAGDGPVVAREAGPTPRSLFLGRVAVTITVVGWLLHVAQVVTRGLAADRLPWGNMYEFTSTMCLAAVTAFLAVLTRQQVRFLGLYVMGLVVLGLGIDGALLYKTAGPLVPALHSYWIAIHVTAATTALGLFTLASVVSALYLFAARHEARLAAGLPVRAGGLLDRLPASGVLDSLAYRIIAVSFPLWTFGVVAGAIWAEAAWGRYWGWDPKETWSFVIWVVYACYLHARVTAGWKGRRAAIIALVAFAAILVNYFVVNVWIVGFHSYAGVNS